MHDSHVRQNIRSFYEPVEMPGGYHFNQVETLKTVDLYYYGQFKTGPYDSQGMRKYFFNIIKPACDVASKAIDLDTKDIILLPEQAEDERRLWLMQRDLRHWLKETEFSSLLNDIGHNLPKYGHVVIKKTKTGKWHLVNLVNLRLDPGCAKLEESPFVYEVLTMTRQEIADMPWDETAKKQLFERDKRRSTYVIYECYDYNTGEGKRYKRTFRADLMTQKRGNELIETPESKINTEVDFLPCIVLHEDELKELPYREMKWESVPGRWLGYGFAEYLFDNQVRMNEIVNIKARGLHWTSKKLFVTSDETLPRNLLTDVVDGQVLRTATGLAPLANEERNLAAFNQEEQRWDKNIQEKTFSFDVVRGDSMPSGTTLGATQLAAGMVASYFELKRENFGLFIKKLLLDDIIPSFVNHTKDHLLKFVGSDPEIEKVYAAVADTHLRQELMDFVVRNGFIPDKAVIDQEKEKIIKRLRKSKDLFFKIPGDFYRKVKYYLDIVITGESVNVSSRVQTLQTALQILGANPNIVADRPTRTIFFKILALAGVSPADVNLLQDQAEQQVMSQEQGMMAGGAPAPTSAVPSPQKSPLASPTPMPGFEQMPQGQAV